MRNVVGTNYADTIVGLTSGGSNLNGGGGNNTILAAGGANTINGGSGGVNTIDYQNSSQAVTVDLTSAADGSGYIHVTAAGQTDDKIENIDNIIGSNHDDSLVGSNATQFITGGSGDSTLVAGNNGETLTVGDGNNSITGGGGNDTISVGTGSNVIDGKGGTNTLTYTGSLITSAVTIHIDTGTTTKTGGGTDSFTNVSQFISSGLNDTIYGNTHNETVTGGSDTITGIWGGTFYAMGGNDSVSGGDGLATLSYAMDTQTGAGVTVVLYAVGTQNTGFGMLTIDNGFGTLIGSSGNDSLTANGSHDSINGGPGNDTLVADNSVYHGADVLTDTQGSNVFVMGDGNTTVTGAGNDKLDYSPEAAAIVLHVDSGTATKGTYTDHFTGVTNFVATAYNDTVFGAASGKSANINLGNGANSYTGEAGNDTVTGGTGNDTYTGGTGSDTWIDTAGSNAFNAGTAALSITGSGSDSLAYTALTSGITLHVDTSTATKAGGVVDHFSGISLFFATSFNDTIYGAAAGNSVEIQTGAGNNLYTAEGGNDNVISSSGNDTFIGSSGNDDWDDFGGTNLFRPGTGNTTITGNSGGTNTLDYSLLGSAITLHIDTGKTTKGGNTDTFTGVTNFIGTNYNDTIYGPSSGNTATINLGGGNNVFYNESGSDTITGGTGNDTYHFSNGFDNVTDTQGTNDYILYVGGETITGSGNDTLDLTVISHLNLNLHIDTGQLPGGQADSFSGISTFLLADGNNTIYGAASGKSAVVSVSGAGNDSYYNMGGNDTVIGGSGNSTYNGGTGTDVWTDTVGADLFAVGSGAVTVTGSGQAAGANGGIAFIGAPRNGSGGGIIVDIATGEATVGSGTVDYFTDINNFGGTNYGDTFYGALASQPTASISFGLTSSLYIAQGGNDILQYGGDGGGGGTGNDTYIGSTGNDTWTDLWGTNLYEPGAGSTTINGGSADTLSYALYTAGGITLHIDTGKTTKGSNTDTFTGVTHFIGTNEGDTIYGPTASEAAVTVQMGTGNNLFTGEGATETITGNSGNDTYVGSSAGIETWIDTGGTNVFKPGNFTTSITGAGGDTADFSNLSESLTLHIDTGVASLSNGVVDHFSGVTSFVGTSHGDTVYGAATGHSATIKLGNADNSYYGGAGDDTVTGGTSYDFYVGGTGNDVWNDTGGGGNYYAPYTGNLTINGSGNDGLDLWGTGTLNAVILHIDTGEVSLSNGNTIIFSGVVNFDDGYGHNTVYGAASGNPAVNVNLGGGGGGYNKYVAEGGNDTINMSNSDYNTLIGSSGNDYYYAGGGNDVYEVGTGNTTITGVSSDTLDYSLLGSAITLHIDTGITTKVGGKADSFSGVGTFIGTNYGDTIYGPTSVEGAVAVQLGTGNNAFHNLGGSDTVIGNIGNDTYIGLGGFETWTDTQGTNVFEPGTGAVSVTGGSTDTLSYALYTASGITLHIDTGTTTKGTATDHFSGMRNFVGTNEGDTIYGAASGQSAVITLGNGNNSYTGEAGNDTVIGGTGKDQYIGGSGTTTVIDTSGGANGLDVLGGAINFTGHAGDAISYSLAPLSNVVIHIDTGTGSHNGKSDTFSGVTTFYGGLSSTIFYGNTLNDTVTGGSDTVIGGLGGNDTFYAMGGNDRVTMENGTNTLSYVNDTVSGTGVDVSLAVTTAQSTNFGTLTLGSTTGFAVLIGSSGNDTLISSFNYTDTLEGGLGNDTLVGSRLASTTTMIDTQGDNYFGIGNGPETIQGSGNDTMDFTYWGGLINVVVNLHIDTGTAVTSGLGGGNISFSGVDNFILPSSTTYGSDTVYGSTAAQAAAGYIDTVMGGSQNDVFYAKGGNDNWNGGAGGNALDFVNAPVGVVINLGVYTAQNTNWGTLTQVNFQEVYGGSGNDTLIGNNLGDTFVGNAGNNSIVGGTGNDLFYVTGNGNNTIIGGGGTDVVSLSSFTSALNVNLATDSAVSGSITESLTGITQVSDNTGLNNTLTGSTANEVFVSSTGNDTIDGGGGNDLIYLGSGNNVIIGEANGSDAIEANTGFGSATTTLNYSNLTSGVIVHLDTGSVTKSGGSDDLSHIDTSALIVTGSHTANNAFYASGLGHDTFNAGLADDTIFETDNASATAGDLINGGTPGSDTLTYNAMATGSISASFNGLTGTITKSLSHVQDNVNNVGNIVGTHQNDTFSLNTSSLLSFSSVNGSIYGNGGNDTVSVTDAATGTADTVLGAQMSSIFSDIGTIDLSGLKNAGDQFGSAFTGSEVLSILGGTAASPLNGGTLNLHLTGGTLANTATFAVDGTFTSYSTVGNTTTFTDGSGHQVHLTIT